MWSSPVRTGRTIGVSAIQWPYTTTLVSTFLCQVVILQRPAVFSNLNGLVSATLLFTHSSRFILYSLSSLRSELVFSAISANRFPPLSLASRGLENRCCPPIYTNQYTFFQLSKTRHS